MTHTPRPFALLGLIAVSIVLGAAPAVAGGVYARTDDQGSIFFTDAPNLRHAVRRDAGEAPRTWTQMVGTPKAVPRDEPRPLEAGQSYVVQARRAGVQGFQMQVTGVLNGRAEVPFLVDTGAAVCSIPRAYLSRLGLTVDDRTPTIRVRGFSGTTEVPVVDVAVVDVGGAVVEHVRMVVTDDLEIGLLGMSFLRHFVVQVDSMAGTVSLAPRLSSGR
jgi:clan AA aspartic protease (TIGR02281 family)